MDGNAAISPGARELIATAHTVGDGGADTNCDGYDGLVATVKTSKKTYQVAIGGFVPGDAEWRLNCPGVQPT